MSNKEHEKIHDTDEPVTQGDPVIAADDGGEGDPGIPVSGPPSDPPDPPQQGG